MQNEKPYLIILPTGASWDWMRTSVLKEMLEIDGHSADTIVVTNYLDEALKAVEKGPKLVIMDSIVCNANPGDTDTHDTAAKLLAKEAKKNPECKTILYTVQKFDIATDEVDVYINALEHDQREQLLEEVKKFTEKYAATV